MNSAPKSDITLLTDEQFDFDLSLSPSSGKEDAADDEVFIGPFGHKEKCVSVCIDAQKSDPEENCPLKPNDQAMWSPLSGDKFVEIFKEAHLLALQLEKSRETPRNKVTQSAVKNPAIEKFVQESKSKLNIFQNGQENAKTPIPIKRETYCVNDSPFNLLPPSIQQRLEFPVEKTCPSPTRSSPSRFKPSPLKAKTPQKISLLPTEAKEKTNSPQSVKRPAAVVEKKCKLQSMKAVSNASKSQHLGVPKPKTRLKLSPLKKPMSKADASEDGHSDKSSVTSDVSDSSFNNSTLPQNKRSLPTASKFGLRKPQLKLPAASARVVPVRKNTSSSSSSQSSINSSLNSSLSVSPLGLNATSFNTSMGNSRSLSNTSLNTSNSSRLPCNLGRIPMARRNGKPSSTLQPNSSDSKKMYKSNSASKLPDLRVNCKPASLAATHPPTPASKIKKQSSDSNLHRISLPSKPPSAVRGNASSKPKAIIAPTPSSQPKLFRPLAGSSTENQVPKIMQPKRLLTSSGIGSGVAASTPLRPPSVGTQQNSCFSARTVSITSSTKRVSALPTPFGRKFSAIPTVTPKTLPRSFSSPHLLDPELTIVSSKKALKNGNKEAEDLQSPESTCPKSSSSDGEAASPNLVPFTLDFSPEKTETAVVAQTENLQSNEVFLLDLGIDKTSALILEPEIKSLIDLSNTPFSRKRSSSLKSETLIDLTSPLILLSPDKENQELFSPLVTF